MRRRRLPPLVLLLAVLAATALAAAPAASAGGGGCHRPPTEGGGATLTLTQFCFSPTVLRVAPGTDVTIVNRDLLDHPLGRPGRAWGWAGAVRDRTTVRLETPGVYRSSATPTRPWSGWWSSVTAAVPAPSPRARPR